MHRAGGTSTVRAERLPRASGRGDASGGHQGGREGAEGARVHEGRDALQTGRRGPECEGERHRGACQAAPGAQDQAGRLCQDV